MFPNIGKYTFPNIGFSFRQKTLTHKLAYQLYFSCILLKNVTIILHYKVTNKFYKSCYVASSLILKITYKDF